MVSDRNELRCGEEGKLTAEDAEKDVRQEKWSFVNRRFFFRTNLLPFLGVFCASAVRLTKDFDHVSGGARNILRRRSPLRPWAGFRSAGGL